LQSTPVRPSTRSYPRFSLPMDSSPGFGSIPCHSLALFTLAFAAAPGATPLASRHRITRRSVLQKVRRHHSRGSDWLWASGFRISFIPRFRGAFHHSLTVLSAIGPLAYLALAGGPARFHRDAACPGVLTCRSAARSLSPTGLSPPVAACSNSLRLKNGFLTAWAPCRAPPAVVQPQTRNGDILDTRLVWASTVSLAATPARSYFLRVREMFQFPGLPPTPLCVHGGVPAFPAGGLPHSEILGSQPARGSPRHFAATPRPSSARAA
jgi:hypothetical protein